MHGESTPLNALGADHRAHASSLSLQAIFSFPPYSTTNPAEACWEGYTRSLLAEECCCSEVRSSRKILSPRSSRSELPPSSFTHVTRMLCPDSRGVTTELVSRATSARRAGSTGVEDTDCVSMTLDCTFWRVPLISVRTVSAIAFGATTRTVASEGMISICRPGLSSRRAISRRCCWVPTVRSLVSCKELRVAQEREKERMAYMLKGKTLVLGLGYQGGLQRP